jgi:hypothetical protein
MKTKDFEKHISHLSQEQILNGGVSTLNKLLVEKGLTTPEELQAGLLDWMKKHDLEAPKHKNKKKSK